MKEEIDLFIWTKHKDFLEPGDTLKTPSRFGSPLDNISNRICKYIRTEYGRGSLVEIDGREYWTTLEQLSLTKETKIKTLTKQIELMESRLKKKKDELRQLL